MTILVKMEHFAQARFWERKLNRWGPIDMDDLAETIDYHHFVDGVQFELITEGEAESLKARITLASVDIGDPSYPADTEPTVAEEEIGVEGAPCFRIAGGRRFAALHLDECKAARLTSEAVDGRGDARI